MREAIQLFRSQTRAQMFDGLAILAIITAPLALYALWAWNMGLLA